MKHIIGDRVFIVVIADFAVGSSSVGSIQILDHALVYKVQTFLSVHKASRPSVGTVPNQTYLKRFFR